MKIAITGASGHVGAALCRGLLNKKHELNVLVRQSRSGLEGLSVTEVKGDILDEEALKKLVEGCEVVYNLAAKISISGDPDGSVHRTNALGPKLVAEACQAAGVRRLIHFSSIHAHVQDPLDQILDETRPYVGDKGFAYDRSKVAGEKAVLAARGKGLEVLVINPTAIIGPYDYRTSLMGEVFRDLYHRRLPSLVKAGFDWVDVRDIVQGAIAAIDQGRDGEKYLFSGNWTEISYLAKVAEEVTDRKAPMLTLPVWVGKLGVPFALAYAKLTGTRPKFTFESMDTLKHSCTMISHEKARRELGYSARPLEETIRDTYDWLQKENLL